MTQIRREEQCDIEAIRLINHDAFGGDEEARIVDALRTANDLEISLVAVDDDTVVGHIAFSPVQVIGNSTAHWDAIALGPMAVAPLYQRRGIGSELVRAGLTACRESGRLVVFVIGHQEFYPRFGFVPAAQYGIKCEYDVPDEVFMVANLSPGALDSHRGTVRYADAFRQA